jgi:ATP/maltotriose-dependent transcriptional regulator MalT
MKTVSRPSLLGRPLTDRQREVVGLIAAGFSNDEVGERLGISARTAKAHADAVRHKLGVSRRRHIPAAFRLVTGEDPLPRGLVAPMKRRGA